MMNEHNYPKILQTVLRRFPFEKVVRFSLLGLLFIFIAALFADAFIFLKHYKIVAEQQKTAAFSPLVVSRTDFEKALEIVRARETAR